MRGLIRLLIEPPHLDTLPLAHRPGIRRVDCDDVAMASTIRQWYEEHGWTVEEELL